MIAITLNGNSINYKTGLVFSEKLNEDLDIGTLIIPQITTLAVKPMDQVVITETGFAKYALVSDVKRITSSFNTPKYYNYILSLVSPTIQLQRIPLPNRAITQPLTGAKTSIYTVLNQYRSIYASSLTISSALQTLTTNVDCPELQWNRPTLFEVFNDLLAEVDCVVTMTDFTTISYLDLNVEGSEISDDYLVDVELQQSILDYGNKIEAEIENAIIGQTNTKVVEWVALKTDQDAALTTDNGKFILDKPIYRINKVTMLWAADPTVFTGASADITSYVVEKSVYDLCDSSISTGIVTGDKKRNRLYYIEGTNIIDGPCFNEDTWLGITSKKAAINILENAYGSTSMVNSDILDVVLQVDYETQETTKIITNKNTNYATLTTQSPISLINNQDTSYVDYKAFVNKQQFNTNRMANATLIITGRYSSLADIPDLGDYYDTNYILSEREYTIYDNHINFKGTLSEYYVLKDIYTGIKTQRRYTQITSEKDALESHHIKEYYFNLAKNFADEISINSNTLDTVLENYIFKFAEADEQIKMIHFKTDSNTDIGVSPSAYYTKKSLSLTYKMQDNFAAGMQVDDSGTGKLMKYVSYTDSGGKFTSLVFKLYKGYDFMSEFPQVTFPIHKIRALPEIDTTLLDSDDLVYTSGTLYRYKDNREITVETIQFNFTHDANTFYGDKFFKDSPFTYTGSTDATLYVAYSTTETYSEGDQVKKGTIADAANLTYGKSTNKININSPDFSITIANLTSWAICDASGNIYIAVNT